MKSLAFIIVGLIVGLLVMFVLMNSGLLVNPLQNQNTLNEKPLVQNIPSGSPNASSTPQTSASPSGTVVTAGGKLSFVTYSAVLPNGWAFKKPEQDPKYDQLELSNGLYKIIVDQTAADGFLCVYPGDPETDIPFKNEYAFFKEITASNAIKLRRSGDSATATNYIACQKRTENFQNPTDFGYIKISTPANPTTAMLQEIDQILSSLKKI